METRRTKLLNRLWDEQNIAYSLMVEYDSLPHQYGQHVLFQAEGYVINCIASYPGITVTELAGILKKTPSACSQIVRKLCDKGLVEQKRNVKNIRSYNLCLTEEGQKLTESHQAFNKECQNNTFSLLEEFSDDDLYIHIMVQKKLNEAYIEDIRRSRKIFVSKKG